MTLKNGRTYLAIPGPSVIPESVLQAMHRSSPNIYEGELVEMTHAIIPKLRSVARTNGNVAIYISNGHGAWEAALTNIANRGDKVLIAATGIFAMGWAEIAQKSGLIVDILDFGTHQTIDYDKLRDTLARCPDYRAVLLTHVDTSTSIKNEIKPIRTILDDLNHKALLAVDCIASLGCDRFEMDAWGVDVMVAACQKGLMVPPGLSFVFFNDRAHENRQTLECVSSYWDWVPRANPDRFYQFFGGTAPTHHLYGLNTALSMIEEEGIENVWVRHHVLAQAIWKAVEHWNTNGPLELNVKSEHERPHAVTTLNIGGPQGTKLRQWVEKNTGLTLGIGLGMSTPDDPMGDGFFRFGHMGHVNAQMIMGLIGTVEAGLNALSIPHGTNALSAAARVIANHYITERA